MNQSERRVISAIWRVLTNVDEAQCKMLDRLRYLAGEEVALDTWLATKPDPEIVEKVLRYRFLVSPMRSVVRR